MHLRWGCQRHGSQTSSTHAYPKGGSSGSAQGSKQPPPAPSSEVVFAEVADNSDQEVNQDVALVQALQANFVTFTDEVEAAQRAARVPKQPAMRRPAGGSLWND